MSAAPRLPEDRAVDRPGRATLERALAVLLLWNSIAGPFLLLMPVLFADEDRMARWSVGVMASSTPTAVAGVWLCVLGLVALEYRRQSNPVWHWVAASFYLLQVLAVFAPIRIVFWTGIFISIPVVLKPGHLMAFNLASVLLLAAHAAMAPRLRGLSAWRAALDGTAKTTPEVASATSSALGPARRAIAPETTTSGTPAAGATFALAAAFEAVLAPIARLAIVDLVLQAIALIGWNPLGGSFLAPFGSFFLAIGVVLGLPLGLICVLSKRLGVNALGAAMLALALANAYRFVF